MTLARTWFREHWQQLVIAATALMVALIFAGTISALVTGRDTNRTVELQRATVDLAQDDLAHLNALCPAPAASIDQ